LRLRTSLETGKCFVFWRLGTILKAESGLVAGNCSGTREVYVVWVYSGGWNLFWRRRTILEAETYSGVVNYSGG
jgi:hypothetical protein